MVFVNTMFYQANKDIAPTNYIACRGEVEAESVIQLLRLTLSLSKSAGNKIYNFSTVASLVFIYSRPPRRRPGGRTGYFHHVLVHVQENSFLFTFIAHLPAARYYGHTHSEFRTHASTLWRVFLVDAKHPLGWRKRSI